MSTQDIVQKLWNLCNVLRDDGITYHQYVTELTYILFLKMCFICKQNEIIFVFTYKVVYIIIISVIFKQYTQ